MKQNLLQIMDLLKLKRVKEILIQNIKS